MGDYDRDDDDVSGVGEPGSEGDRRAPEWYRGESVFSQSDNLSPLGGDATNKGQTKGHLTLNLQRFIELFLRNHPRRLRRFSRSFKAHLELKLLNANRRFNLTAFRPLLAS